MRRMRILRANDTVGSRDCAGLLVCLFSNFVFRFVNCLNIDALPLFVVYVNGYLRGDVLLQLHF